jgi:hypothetical protein
MVQHCCLYRGNVPKADDDSETAPLSSPRDDDERAALHHDHHVQGTVVWDEKSKYYTV